jgi:glycosyltransferase involved in cell wall biosynthesis
VNVGFVSDGFPMGGIAKVVKEIGSVIEEEGYSSFYLAASGDPSNYYNIPDSKLVIPKAEIRSTKVGELKNKIKKLFEMKIHNNTVDLSKYLRRQQRNIEQFVESKELDYLIICRYDLSFLVSNLKLKYPRLKIFIWIHGPVELYTKKKERKKYLPYYRQCLLDCDSIICLTEYDLCDLKEIGVTGTKIYNPISFTNVENSETLEKEKSILCVSRLDIHDKGIDSLVKLADRLPNGWKVNLVGTGKSNEIERFRYLVSKMKNKNQLVFLGPKNTEELKKIYQLSTFFVSPSLYEGFGLTLVEAMNFGLPIVAFETNGAKEVTENGKYGVLVENFSVESLIQECLSLLDNAYYIKKYTQLSLLRSKKFNIKNIKKQWLALLEG